MDNTEYRIKEQVATSNKGFANYCINDNFSTLESCIAEENVKSTFEKIFVKYAKGNFYIQHAFDIYL